LDYYLFFLILIYRFTAGDPKSSKKNTQPTQNQDQPQQDTSRDVFHFCPYKDNPIVQGFVFGIWCVGVECLKGGNKIFGLTVGAIQKISVRIGGRGLWKFNTNCHKKGGGGSGVLRK
jgi:hypothetical protein